MNFSLFFPKSCWEVSTSGQCCNKMIGISPTGSCRTAWVFSIRCLTVGLFLPQILGWKEVEFSLPYRLWHVCFAFISQPPFTSSNCLSFSPEDGPMTPLFNCCYKLLHKLLGRGWFVVTRLEPYPRRFTRYLCNALHLSGLGIDSPTSTLKPDLASSELLHKCLV